MKVSKKRTLIAAELRNAAHVILETQGYAAHTMSKGKMIPHHEAKVLDSTLRRVELPRGEQLLNISSGVGNYLNVQWGKSGGVHATRFIPGPWEQTIRDAATAIDPDWPLWAGLTFIDFDALKVTDGDIQRRLDAAEATIAEAALCFKA